MTATTLDALVGLQRTLFGPWVARAACKAPSVDPRIFHDPHQANAARAVCARCPVRTDCLTYAIEHGEDSGVWGGRTALQRRGGRRRPERQPLTIELTSDRRTDLVQLLALVHHVLTEEAA